MFVPNIVGSKYYVLYVCSLSLSVSLFLSLVRETSVTDLPQQPTQSMLLAKLHLFCYFVPILVIKKGALDKGA